MSKVYSDQIEKTRNLLKGLKSNAKELEQKGLDNHFISRLEADTDTAATYNAELDKLKAETRSKTIQANRKLMEIKEQVRSAKRIVKRDYDKSLWPQFGILDKK